MDSSRFIIWIGLALALFTGFAKSGVATAQDSPESESVVDDEGDDKIYALAAAFYTDQDWEQAAEQFQKLVDRYPDGKHFDNGLFYLGESLVQAGNHVEAREVFARFLEQSPQQEQAVRARFRLAECQFLNQEFAAAKTGFLSFLEENTNSPLTEFALPYLGELHLRFGEVEQSQRIYETALEKFPTSGLSNKCRLGLARALSLTGQVKEAERFYQFVSNQPDEVLADDALMLNARMYGEQGDWEHASAALERLINEHPESEFFVEATYLSAKRSIAEGKWQESWDILNPLLTRTMESDLFVRLALDAAVVAVRIDQLARAQSLIDQVRKQNPGDSEIEFASVVEIDIASRNRDAKRLQKLVRDFESQFQSSEHITRCVEPLARLHYERSEFALAAVRYQQLLDLIAFRPELPGNASAWRYLAGLSRIGTGEYGKALSNLTAIEDFGQNEPFRAATSFAIATAHAGQENWPESIEHYQDYLSRNPDGEDAVRCQADLAVAQANADDLKQAMETIDQVTGQHSQDPTVLHACEVIAEIALEKQQSEGARKYFRILAKASDARYAARGANGLVWSGDEDAADPGHLKSIIEGGADIDLAVEAMLGKVQQLQAADQHQESIELLEQIIESWPESGLIDETRFRLGVSLQRLGEPENSSRAVELFTTFLSNQPKHELADLARYELAWAEHDRGDIDLAAKRFCEIVDDHPESEYRIDACYRAAVLLKQKEPNTPARLRLRQLVAWAPNHELAPYAWYTLGEMESRCGNWEEAIKAFTQVVEQSDDVELVHPAQYWIAESHWQQGNHKEAETGFREIRDVPFEKSDIRSVIWLRLAQCAAKRTAWTEVESIVQQCRDRDDIEVADHQVDYLLGRVYMSRAKFNEAREMFTRVLKSAEVSGTETAAMSQWMIGESWFHQEQYKDALRAYLLVDSLYDYEQWRSLALLQASKCHLLLGDTDRARKTCDRMLNTFPDSDQATAARQLLADIDARQKSGTPSKPASFSK